MQDRQVELQDAFSNGDDLALLKLSSKLGQGAERRVVLPMAHQSGLRGCRLKDSVNVASGRRRRLKGQQISDSEDERPLVRASLRRRGSVGTMFLRALPQKVMGRPRILVQRGVSWAWMKLSTCRLCGWFLVLAIQAAPHPLPTWRDQDR